MRKALAFIFSFLIISSCFSQNEFAHVSGTILREPMNIGKIDSVEMAEIILKINDTLKLKTLSDKNGKYEFNIKRFEGCFTLTCEITKQTKVKGRKNPCIITNGDTRVIKMNKSKVTDYLADFLLKEGCCYLRPPEILFTENSLEFETDTTLTRFKSSEELNGLFEILIENPTIIIQLDAHSDFKEKNKEVLSKMRGDKIASLLIQKGINKGRIIMKSFGSSLPFYSEKQIKEAKNPAEKIALRTKNRRVTFKVISFDFGVSENDIQKRYKEAEKEAAEEE